MGFFRTITTKPWLQDSGNVEPIRGGATLSIATPRIGLFFLLAVITSMFFLFTVAYFMRMGFGDWSSVSEPQILWLNTATLVLSSIAFEWSRRSARRGNGAGARIGLFVAGVLAIAFIAGQLVAWSELSSLGVYVYTNPASSFFYVLTGLHGLHLLGGLVAWARTVSKVAAGREIHEIRMSVELCAVYWHFLLAVWLGMFWLLSST